MKKPIHPCCNHMSSVAETSFFCPKMSGFPILNWGQLTDCGLILISCVRNKVLLTYLLTYLVTYVFVYLFIYLFTYLSTYL